MRRREKSGEEESEEGRRGRSEKKQEEARERRRKEMKFVRILPFVFAPAHCIASSHRGVTASEPPLTCLSTANWINSTLLLVRDS